MTKFGQVADAHLRASQYGHTERALDFHRAFEFVITDAHSRGLDALLSPGDLLDTTKPTAFTMQLLQHLHNVAIALRMPIYTICGNHDRTNPHWSSILQDGNGYGFIPVDNKRFRVGELTGEGVPYMDDEALVQRLPSVKEADIVMWHGMIAEMDGVSPGSVSAKVFSGKALRMLLLGDIHIRQYKTLDLGGYNCLVGYPGSTELCSSSEVLEKSYEVFEVDGDSLKHYPVKIPTRPVYRELIQSIEAADKFIQTIQDHRGAAPIILVKYSRDLSGFKQRLEAAAPKDSILQAHSLPKMINIMGQIDLDEKIRPISEFAETFFPDDPLSQSIAKRLLPEDADVREILEEFLDSKLKKYETTST